jgi:hypothetical protein
MLELARIAVYGGLSPAFAAGYKLTPDVTAALDRETGIERRLYTIVMLCLPFWHSVDFPIKLSGRFVDLKNFLVASGGGMVAI